MKFPTATTTVTASAENVHALVDSKAVSAKKSTVLTQHVQTTVSALRELASAKKDGRVLTAPSKTKTRFPAFPHVQTTANSTRTLRNAFVNRNSAVTIVHWSFAT